MKPLKTAILGCGQIAHQHARVLTALPERAELIAFCDRDLEKAQAFSRQYTGGRAAAHDKSNLLLSIEPLDLLVICLPPYSHADEVQAAADRGIHLLIEKPIALKSDKAWQMVTACEKAGIKTQIGFKFRFGKALEALKTKMASGKTGELALFTAGYFCNSLHANWWRDKSKSGGQLVEQVIHMFDLCRYLGGEVQSIFSSQKNLFHQDVPGYTIEDTSATLLNFINGGIGVIYATNNAIPGKWLNDYRIVTRKIMADFKDANQAVFHYTDQEPVHSETISESRDLFSCQMIDLLDAIEFDTTTRTPISEGAKSLDLVLAAAQSAEKNQLVTLK